MNQQNITPDSTEEHWTTCRFIKPDGVVETYPNYMVSDRGRIGSLMNNVGNKRPAMKILKPCGCDKQGHQRVCLFNNKKAFARSVHRIVLSSFHSELWSKDTNEVDHINRIPTDNRLVNLHWTDRNGNNANRTMNPLKQIRVTYLSDGHIELFDNMYECSRAFEKSAGWCNSVICLLKGFNTKYNIRIEKI